MADFTTPDGIRLHYTDEGKGLPILCLAGLTRNGRDFDHVAPHIPTMMPVRLIRLDYRGRGGSDWAPPETYSIPQEMADVIALLDHLKLDKVAILGTSRGGLIAMLMAAAHHDRLLGVALNDIGPDIEQSGLDIIADYVGRTPAQKTYGNAAAYRAATWTHFQDVPMDRWRAEVENHYIETPDGLELRYDPALRDAVLAAIKQPAVDLWPLYDAINPLPLALIRGANSDLLGEACADEMLRRRPDMIRADIAGRGHVPFLDEPEALDAIHEWLEDME